MSAATRTDDDAPVAQSLRIGFAVLRGGMLALAAYWATSNIRTVPPDSQAVTLRFGAPVGVRDAGLVLAWPRPVEDVVLLPGPQRQLELRIDAGAPVPAAIIDPASRAGDEVPPATAAVDLTGDGGAVLLDAVLFYRVSDASAYVLAEAHVVPALRRLFLAASVAVMARSSLNDVIVVQSAPGAGTGIGAGAAEAAQQARREALRGALVDEVNRRLDALARAGAPLGVSATRTDIAAFLPPAAKFAFDSVLEASQMAEQGLAAARTDATRAGQNASHESDRLLAEARANGNERVAAARAHEAAIGAVNGDPRRRPSLVDQLYRERIAGILHAAGSVSTVDPRSGRVLLPGAGP